LSIITIAQFRFWGKRAANIEGINLKGLKSSLEKVLTYAHITTKQGWSLPWLWLVLLEK
jgi:membrane-associated PAP2 superfamily phosphatase